MNDIPTFTPEEIDAVVRNTVPYTFIYAGVFI